MAVETIQIPSGSTKVPGELYSPSSAAPTGVIVIAYGLDGLVDNEHGPWETMIRGYADGLAKLGFFALIPDYFGKTATAPGAAAVNVMMIRRSEWATALVDSVNHVRGLSGVDSARVGLLGFSLGGHLCLRARAAAKPKALVEYFAPKLDGIGSPGHVPKAQIHHGMSDTTPGTDFSNAGAIEAILKLEGTAVTVFPYKGAGHGFAGRDEANKKASLNSQKRTFAFFRASL